MRKLSKKQKNIIIDYIKDGYFNYTGNSIFDISLLIDKHGNETILLKQLKKVNDYELLYQDYRRLKDELLFKETIEDKIKCVLDFN